MLSLHRMDAQTQAGDAGLPGPAIVWLRKFERSRLERINMLILGQMLALMIFCACMMLAWVWLEMMFKYSLPGKLELLVFVASAAVLWLGCLLWLRRVALGAGLPHFRRMFEKHPVIERAMESSMHQVGESLSFQKQLRSIIRSLPSLMRVQPGGWNPETWELLRSFSACLLLLLAWIAFLQYLLGRAIELSVFGLLLAGMLYNYRSRLNVLVRELATARKLLGMDDPADVT